MRLFRVAPLGGSQFVGPGSAYHSSVGGTEHYFETPENSPRGHHYSWRKPQCELLTSPTERGGEEGTVPGPMGGHSGWWMPHHAPPTSLVIECNGGKDAVGGPRGGQNGWCMPPHDIPTSQPPRHDSWCMPQHEPWTSPRQTGLCIPQKCNGAEGAMHVGYYMQVPMVMMIPMCPHFAQDTSQRLTADVPASGGGLHTKTTPNRSVGGWHENVDKENDLRRPRTTRDSASPGANMAASREVPAGFTTLVVRNIPARYTQNMLLREFGGLDGSFDFFYQPYSFQDSKTVGIAFVNFRSHQAASCFQEMWHRRFLRDHGRTKHLDVVAATIQGLAGNLKQFTPKSIARLESVGRLPAFFDNQGNRLNSIGELRRHGILP